MDIDLKLLRSLVSIYELGSISRAAEQLCCTQAAMSMRLKLLEEEVGNPLFERRHHRMEPTPFGSQLYARALAVLASYDELISATRTRARSTTIRIGVPDDYAHGLLTKAMRHVASKIDDAELHITCDLSANLFAAFHRQDLDIALVTLASPPSGARFCGKVDLAWVRQAGCQVATGAPVLLSVYPEGCVFRRAMISALEAAEIPWRVAAQSSRQAGVLSAVRAGLAITVMASGTVPDDLQVSREMTDLPTLQSIPIYFMRSQAVRHPAVAAIEDALRTELNVDRDAA